MELKEDDVVMCTVKKIEGTTVFVEIEGNGEGSIVMSEIAAGRIRNLREYVTINKKIVCKVLKIAGNDIRLTLRRVTAKEREEVKERYQKEQTIRKLLKVATKDPEKIIKDIESELSLAEFFDTAKENPKILDKFMKEEEAQQLAKLVAEKKEKDKEAKQTITIKSMFSSGIKDIKETLTSIPNRKDLDIKYLGSSKFSVSAIAKDVKDANNRILSAVEAIKAKAKDKKLIFESQ